MKIQLDAGAKCPTRAHPTDAGLDLYANETRYIPANGYAVFDTGVHIAIPEGFVGILKSKSGLNIKHNIISDGTIDAGYTGSIKVKLYNLGMMDYKVTVWDKITQLVILPILTPDMEIVPTLEKTDRGDNGFGSSGK